MTKIYKGIHNKLDSMHKARVKTMNDFTLLNSWYYILWSSAKKKEMLRHKNWALIYVNIIINFNTHSFYDVNVKCLW